MHIAIVTGASSGMGKEFVKQLDDWKFDEIWCVARREDRLLALQNDVNTKLRPVVLDLSQKSSIDAVRSLLETEKPSLGLLVNCAGFAKFGKFADIRPEDSYAMVELNINALMGLCYCALPHMPQGGRIINIASTAAFQPLPDMNVYAASKAFVLSFSRALGREIGDLGISVTTVCPGWTKTEFFDVGRKNADQNAITELPFMSKPENVVRHALKAAQKRKDLAVYGIFNKFHLFFARILPTNSIMTLWNAMR
ncbi:MAG: SDR family NAD(P)-dependent oxidoreductase [Christensenellaceae bacterium]